MSLIDQYLAPIGGMIAKVNAKDTATLERPLTVHDLVNIWQCFNNVLEGGTISLYDETVTGIAGLTMTVVTGTQNATMYYTGAYSIAGLEYGTCQYDAATNSIKNSTLEVDLGTLAAAATTIDLAPVAFAGIVRVTADAGGNFIDTISNGTNAETYQIRKMTSANFMSLDGGTGNIYLAILLDTQFGASMTLTENSLTSITPESVLSGVRVNTTNTQ